MTHKVKPFHVVFALIIGRAVASFRNGQVDDDEVIQAAVSFGVLATILGISNFVQHASFTIAAQRQMNRLRVSCLSSMLRQEIAWFDVQTGNGDLASR